MRDICGTRSGTLEPPRLSGATTGAINKLLGDAVMAVSATPFAHEDDPVRAVRAALDLVAAVSSLGDEVGAPSSAPARVS